MKRKGLVAKSKKKRIKNTKHVRNI